MGGSEGLAEGNDYLFAPDGDCAVCWVLDLNIRDRAIGLLPPEFLVFIGEHAAKGACTGDAVINCWGLY